MDSLPLRFAQDDLEIPVHNTAIFFLQLRLDFPEEQSLSKCLNFPYIIDETLRNTPQNRKVPPRMRIRANSYDFSLSSSPIISAPRSFLSNLARIQNKMKWALLDLIDFLFQNHKIFLSLEVPNLISSILSILTDVALMEEIEVIEGKLEKILRRICLIEATILKTGSRDLIKPESAFLRVKTSFSPKHSLFKPSFEHIPASPQHQSQSPIPIIIASPMLKSGPGSPLNPSGNLGNLKPYKNPQGVKKVLCLMRNLKFLLIPLFMFGKYRQCGEEMMASGEAIRKLSGTSMPGFILNKNKGKKSAFSQEKTVAPLRRMQFLQSGKELEKEFDERLLGMCKEMTKRWVNMKRLKELQMLCAGIRQILVNMDQELMVCHICGVKIASRFLREHSFLCKENDLLLEKLKASFNSFLDSEIIWMDQTIRKAKNTIPIIKQQIERLSRKFSDPSKLPSQLGFSKPPKGSRVLKTCPSVVKPLKKDNNMMIMQVAEDDQKVDFENIMETLRKFKAIGKTRELNGLVKEKEVLEYGRNGLKTLLKMNENIRNYRKLEITFAEESNGFLMNLLAVKGKIDEKIREKALEVHKKSQEIFAQVHQIFNIKKKLDASFLPAPPPRHHYSLNTSPLPCPNDKRPINWIRESHKKRSNTSLDKMAHSSDEKLEEIGSALSQRHVKKPSFYSGQHLSSLFSDHKRRTLEEKDYLLLHPLSQANSRNNLDADSFPESQEIQMDSSLYKSDTLNKSDTLSDDTKPFKASQRNESWFSDQSPPKKTDHELDLRFFSEQMIENEKYKFNEKNEDAVSLEDFTFIKLISKGAFGRVWLVSRKATGKYYAMKIINFADKLTTNHLEMLKNESEAFKRLKGEYFVSAIFTFSHENFICFVMEYMYGGDLGALLEKEGYFSGDTAKYYIAEIIQAVGALHNIQIIHRDLKPDNVLIDSQGHLKLTDFGLSDLGLLIRKELCGKTCISPLGKGSFFENKEGSQTFPEERNVSIERCLTYNEIQLPMRKQESGSIKLIPQKSKSKLPHNIVGTPDYMSPEVLNGSGLKEPGVDWWSVGVILFEFLTGIPPFNDETTEQIFDNIRNHRIPWDQIPIGYEEGSISPDAQDLINRLLDPNPKKRLGSKGVEEIQKHRFFRGVDWGNLRKRTPEYIPRVDNVFDVGNFERKKVYEENEKEDPLFGHESNNSQIMASNMLKSTSSFHMKRSDMLFAENEREFNKFDEKKKIIQVDLEQKEMECRMLENCFWNSTLIPSIDFGEENGFIKEF